jgi:hypothetical protein
MNTHVSFFKGSSRCQCAAGGAPCNCATEMPALSGGCSSCGLRGAYVDIPDWQQPNFGNVLLPFVGLAAVVGLGIWAMLRR